jgi:ABC-type multidrug transport system ATPase subunit
MTAVIETDGLGKRFGHKWALRDCNMTIPEGKVVGLVGPNGAGKTTFLHLAVGLLAPSAGAITVLGGRPDAGAVQLEKVGFVAQDTPVYAGLSVAKHLRMRLPKWTLGQRARRKPDCSTRPRPTPEGGITVGWPASPTGTDSGHREASRDPLAR